MSVSLERGTTIGRLRLRAAAADPNALRMRGGTIIGALDLQPPAMPRQAILCIRTLHDPMPGGLDLRFSTSPRPVAWEAAMRGAVGEALRRAARPALGPVPANAEAVLFADRAELLACAARDALRGTLSIHWWWTHLLGGERSPTTVAREWTRSPAYVPAAVELLAERDEITDVARTFAPADAFRLLEAVLRAHALPELAFDIVTALTTSLALPPAPIANEARLSSYPQSRPPAERLATPPWRSVLPDLALTELTVEQQSFVAVALLLRRAPALMRSERFGGQITAWIESERRSERSRDAPVTPEAVEADPSKSSEMSLLASGRGGSGRSGGGATRPGDPSPFQGEQTSSPFPHPNISVHEVRTPPEIIDAAARSVVVSGTGGSGRSGGSATRPGRPEPQPPLYEAGPPPGITASSTEPAALQAPRPDLAIDSNFAGVFFLLNVGIALGLYSDFTSAAQHGITLDVWDFLALAGGTLAGSENFADDPIAPLLAALANRKDGEAPGAGFVPPEGESPGEWLDFTVGRIRERLALAGIEDPARVVRRYGRVTTTPAHLDAYFSLAAHPIDIRAAGLDRDPGWIPAAGRHVAFHFD